MYLLNFAVIDCFGSSPIIFMHYIKQYKLQILNPARTPRQAHLQGTQSRHTKANHTKEPALCRRFWDTPKVIATFIRWTQPDKGLPTTLVLLQVGLDIETSAVCIAVLLFRQTNIYLAFCC